MIDPPLSKGSFHGYPKAREAPTAPYERAKASNPVITGIPIVICAFILSKFNFLLKIMWYNAGFQCLRNLEVLKDYDERWDPTVASLSDEGQEAQPLVNLAPDIVSPPGYFPGHSYTVSEYHDFFLSGTVTPLAVAEHLLSLIRTVTTPPSPYATAFISINPEATISAARESTLRYQSKTSISILDGVPTAIKDEFDIEGYQTTNGRKLCSTPFKVATESSWQIRNLEKAGAVILGKLNMHEVGGDVSNNNPNYGSTLNPYNNAYYTGGSSGGAGYAVSIGLVPFTLGTDAGGSIRLPSSFCSIYGLKPSHGRLGDMGSTVSAVGPIANTMADLEIAYDFLLGPTRPVRSTSISTSSRPKVMGIFKSWIESADKAAICLFNKTLDYYQAELGYEIVDISLPLLPQGQIAHAMTILMEIALRARRFSSKSNWISELNLANQLIIGVGAQTPHLDMSLAQQHRNMLMQHLSYLYQKYPGLIIVTPTCPMVGWPVERKVDLKYGASSGNMTLRAMEYTWLANFCGNPAITCPIGYAAPIQGEGKIPVGIMAMGEWGSERDLFAWGRDCERYIHGPGGGRVKPESCVDVIRDIQQRRPSFQNAVEHAIG